MLNKINPLQIRCTARVHEVYWQTTEKSIEEEREKFRPIVNVVQSTLFDQTFQDGEGTSIKDTYKTDMQGKNFNNCF